MNHRFKLYILLLLLPIIKDSHAQNIDPRFLHQRWSASWISVPGEQPSAYGVYLFRKQIELDTKPSSFIVHVSADNRYKLYVNGRLASLGPARGDINHWNFETVDIAPHLKPGKNIIAAKVWNEAEWRPEAQISLQTGFILQGAGKEEEIINTDTSWTCIRDDSYSPIQIRLPAYFVTGPGEQVDMSRHIRNWQHADYPETGWKKARAILRGEPKGFIGPYGTISGWMLVPSPLPPMEIKYQRFDKLRRVEGISADPSFPAKPTPITIPANTSATVLLDQSSLTNAYLSLAFSGGKGAGISITYAEALYSKHPVKGNRNEVEGKYIMGRKDSILADGSDDQFFTTLYWRSFRYVELKLTTRDQPLVIKDIYSEFTGYPFEYRAKLEAVNPELQKMLGIGWHTARLCAIETYMDCPYYEQLQYIGDTRIQGLVSLYNSGDDRLLKNAINQADQSRLPEGVTLSRHPSYTPQYIPTFSLWYIGMLHDYWRYGSDTGFVKTKLAGTRQVLNFFRGYQQKDGSLKGVPHWLFTDWVYEKHWESGRGPVGADGYSAMLDLQLLWAYQLAAEMEQRMGMNAYAIEYRHRAAQLQATIQQKYWDAGRKLFADRTEKDLFSQHTNSLAILTGMVDKAQAKEISRAMLQETNISKATIYFKYYLHRAMIKAGLGNQYLHWLDKWRENIQMGLTTWAEMSEVGESRSDCHAWGSSPNIEFFRTILGIDSDAPGFARVKIEPHLGTLEKISGEIPHPQGTISASYTNQGTDWHITISLPPNVQGRLVWRGGSYKLDGGRNRFTMK